MLAPVAPIALFAFNRPEHLRRTLAALADNQLAKDSHLVVFADGPRDEGDLAQIAQTREIIKSISGFKSVETVLSEVNRGLAMSIIQGVTQLMQAYGKVIVLEDDLVVSGNFLTFMNDCLDFYAKDERIFSISGYNYPISLPPGYPHDVFMSSRFASWGWASWQNRWQYADWEVRDFPDFIRSSTQRRAFSATGEDLVDRLIDQKLKRNSSWAVRWNYAHFKHQKYCLRPCQSKIQNIGHDGSGVHCGPSTKYDVALSDAPYKLTSSLEENEFIRAEIRKFFTYSFKYRVKRTFLRQIDMLLLRKLGL